MLNIDTISDPHQLKQIALLLQKENDRIHQRLLEMTLELEMKNLQSQMSKLQKMLFGASSERRIGDSEELEQPKKIKKPRTGHGPKEQLQLDSIKQVYELPEVDKVCESCGGGLEEWEGQHEEFEEIGVVQRIFFIRKNKQKKYRCKCGGCIKVAPKPLNVIKGGRYTTEFSVEVAVEKYLDHMPLERQVRKMNREGLRVDSQTLWDQIWSLSQLLKPAYDRLLLYIFSFSVICADETIWYS